jgi:TRAP-type C4-dicarboxylate transport system permease small subunit
MNSKIKSISGVQIPPLFYKKHNYKGALIVAIIGLLGSLLSLGKFVWFSDSAKNITDTDTWETLVLSLFLVALFLPLSGILYFASMVTEILDTLTDNKGKLNDDSGHPNRNEKL